MVRLALVLAAVVGVAFVAQRLLGDGDRAPADPRGADVQRFVVDSALTGERLEQIAIAPEGARDRPPLLVLLHAFHGDERGPDRWLTDELFTALRRLGEDAPALLLVNGGVQSYFHDRADGRWAAYVLREAIPTGMRRLGADPGRVALGGISMGGFGALHLARQRRFCAVGGHSPALWLSAGETPAGAFDDAEDFADADPLANAAPSDVPTWLDVGEDDPFREATLELGRRIGVKVRVRPGGHEGAYWRSHLAEYLRFYARALRDC